MKKLSTRILAISLFSITLLSLCISGVALYTGYTQVQASIDKSKEILISDYDALIRSQVQSVVSELDAINNRIKKGELTEKQGKDIAAGMIRSARYGKDGYFWADTDEGVNVVLLGRKDVEGTYRRDAVDSDGVKFIDEFIKILAADPSGGYLNFRFPKAGTKEPLPKRGYVQKFIPWGWMIGTGNYVNDLYTMTEANRAIFIKNLKYSSLQILAITFAGIILNLVLLNMIRRPIDRSLQRIKDVVADEKDLTKRINLESKDELGEMAGWFDKFIDKVHNNIINIAETKDHVETAANDLTSLAQNMVDSTTSIAHQAEMIVASSTEVNQNLQVVSSAIEEMSVSIAEVAKKASESAGVAEQANKISADTTEVVRELGMRAKEIGAVIESISQIAAQTNLLALNAAIEAAGAGDAGKGFAVVASEVKELARQTAESSEDIKEKIGHIQATTEKTVNAMGDMSQIIVNINEISSSIASAVEEQSITAKEIAGNVQHTGLAAADVNKSITQINQSTVESAKRGEEGNRLVERLTADVEDLHRVVNQFKFEKAS